ncbi:MAG: SAM-dependent methyltransferase [Gammaproteobacteria bacterium]|nr:SAM-dependent methyltransferase [Gammaproteobacteria bacterium]
MQHSSVLELIHAELLAHGPLSFDSFMDLALYAPDAGYYDRGHSPFGAGADFVTAPLISPLFARCLARQIASWMRDGGFDTLIELGPGDGTLCVGLLRALEELDCMPRQVLLVERSRYLRELQATRLRRELGEQVSGRVRWLVDWPSQGAAATPLEAVVLANELLDAIPAHRVRLEQGRWRERCVALQDGRLVWQSRAIEDPALRTECETLLVPLQASLPDGYTTELFPRRNAFVRALGSSLRRGTCLFIDYGYPRAEYYHPQRVDGSLRCHVGQQRHDDPLHAPGHEDISVHVEFTRLAEVASGVGLQLTGFSDQAQFLLGSGVLDTLSEQPSDTRAYAELAHQVRQLTMPGEMGEAIKLMQLCTGDCASLSLLTLRDQRYRL